MMTFVSVWLVSLSGFACLALGMRRHQQYLAGSAPGSGAVLAARVAGLILLAASVWLGLEGRSQSMGWTIWFGVATFSALALGLIFTYCKSECGRILFALALCASAVLIGLRMV